MKKFWKNLCVCSMAVVSAMSLWACGKPAPEVSVDLDGDGVISAWETIFNAGDKLASDRQHGEVVEISDLAGLKAINDNTSQSKVYKLVKNINCGGETLSIDLGTSTLLGNNNIIKNFKLGDCYQPKAEGQTEIQANVKGLFYNGVAIYDLRLFVGHQTIDLNTNKHANTIISPLINVSNIENIEVRGRITVDRADSAGIVNDNIDISLLNANVNQLGLADSTVKSLSIRKSSVVGKIVYKADETHPSSNVRIGGVIPHNAKGGIVSDVNSSVDIDATSQKYIYIGGIAGESDDFITSCTTSGEIKLLTKPNMETKLGGIVGVNNKNGEIKNCSTTANLIFDQEIDGTGQDLYMGGIAGCNYGGVMTYVTSDANMTINNALKCEVGGIAGRSEDSIVANVISRGSITCNKVSNVNVAEMIGVSKKGYYETAVVTTNININNGEINSTVNLGMLTIFEDFSIDAMYNAENAPNFTGILLGSKNNVYMKPGAENSSTNAFDYNLGLRNPFKYVVIDEATGQPKEEERVDQYGNPVLDKNDNVIMDIVTATLVPDIYNQLYYTSGYNVTKYNVSGDVNVTEPLTFTYAKDNSNASIVSECSDSRISVNFFVRTLGFKYGLNHSEIDLTNLALDKIKFTLPESEASTRYFEKKSYNGEMIYFDRFIEDECTFDMSDEMFSLLHSIIVSDSTNKFIPIKVSREFVNSEMDEETDDETSSDDAIELPQEELTPLEDEDENDQFVDNTLSIIDRFALCIQKTINSMFDITPRISQLTADKVDCMEYSGEGEPVVKYVRLTFTTKEFSYQFTFDVSTMVADIKDELEDSYIIYLHYVKYDNGMMGV